MIKFRYTEFHFVLRVHTWLWWNSCHRFHVVYLEINVKCYWNFFKSKKRELTFTYEYTIKKCLTEWDRATPLMKKWGFLAWNSFVSITKLLDVSKLDESKSHECYKWGSGWTVLGIFLGKNSTGWGWEIFMFLYKLFERRQVVDDIWEHPLCDEIKKNYTTWIWHGEFTNM